MGFYQALFTLVNLLMLKSSVFQLCCLLSHIFLQWLFILYLGLNFKTIKQDKHVEDTYTVVLYVNVKQKTWMKILKLQVFFFMIHDLKALFSVCFVFLIKGYLTVTTACYLSLKLDCLWIIEPVSNPLKLTLVIKRYCNPSPECM